MKKLINILIIVLLVGFTSCNELDLTPIGQLSGSNFPATDAEAIALTNAVYYPNIRISTALGYVIDLTSDVEANGENPNSGGDLLSKIQWDPSNSYVATVWQNLYEIVTRANDVVDKISVSKTISSDLKTRLVGEAKFLRAYSYFYLVQLWGEVPLVLHNVDGSNTTRASVDEVYTQIIQDLKDAAASLPAVSEYAAADRGRASKGSANAYLSKVNLVWGQTSESAGSSVQKERYSESVKYANLVTGYSLEEKFLDNWSNKNRNGKESVFSVQHIQGEYAAGDGGNHLVHCSFYGGYSNTVLPHVFATSNKWLDDFDNRDQRKRGTYIKHLWNPKTNSTFVFDRIRYAKYIDTTDVNTSANTRDINRSVIRYAEVLLLKAEAINELNGAPNAEAYEAVNQVRRRAFKHFPVTSSSSDDLPTGLDYAGFKAKIQSERLLELTYEQNRYTDLKRWRIYVKTLRNAVTSGYALSTYLKQNVRLKNYRLPIPKGQRDINPTGLWQNWGYDGYDESKTGANPYSKYEPDFANESIN